MSCYRNEFCKARNSKEGGKITRLLDLGGGREGGLKKINLSSSWAGSLGSGDSASENVLSSCNITIGYCCEFSS